MKIIYIAKDGFPIEGIIGKPTRTFFRRLFLTRKITTYNRWLKKEGRLSNLINLLNQKI